VSLSLVLSPVEVNHQSNDKRMDWRGLLSAYSLVIGCCQGCALVCPAAGVFVAIREERPMKYTRRTTNLIAIALLLIVALLLSVTPGAASVSLAVRPVGRMWEPQQEGPSIKPADMLLYFAEVADNRLVVTEFNTRKGSKRTVLAQRFTGTADLLPVLSPNTDRIAVLVIPDGENVMWHSEIWAGDLQGGSLQRVISGAMPPIPVWNNDGTKLAYTKLLAMEGTSYQIEVRSLDFPSLRDQQLALRTEAMEIHPLAWSMDDTTLYYQRFLNGGEASIWSLDVSQGTSQLLIEGDQGQLPYEFALSPNGDRIGIAWVNREQAKFVHEVRILDLHTRALRILAQSSYLQFGDLCWSASGESLLFGGSNQLAGLQKVLIGANAGHTLDQITQADGTHLLDVFPDGQLLVAEDTSDDWNIYVLGMTGKELMTTNRFYLGSREMDTYDTSVAPTKLLGSTQLQLPPNLQPLGSTVVPYSLTANGTDIVADAQAEVDNESHYVIGAHGQSGDANPYHYVFRSGGHLYDNYCHTYPNRGLCTAHRHFDCIGLVDSVYYENGVSCKLYPEGDCRIYVVSTLFNWWEQNWPDRVHRDYNWSGREPGDPVIVNNENHIGIYAGGDRLINASGNYCDNPQGCAGEGASQGGGVVNDPLSNFQSGFVAYLDIDWEGSSGESVIVEDPNIDPDYGGGMCDSSWYRFLNNRGHYAYLTLNTNDPPQSTNWADWHPNLPQSGDWEVEAYIAHHGSINWECPSLFIPWDTSDARYTIYHADGSSSVSGNQAPLDNQWLYLGMYRFNAGTSGWVKLTDLNGEANLSRTVSFSAMRFTLQTPPSPMPVIINSLIILQSPPYYVGQTLTARFTIQNQGDAPITFDKLVAGGRLNGVNDCSNYVGGECPDFTMRYNITLNPGDSYAYEGTFTPALAGTYDFQVFYFINDDWHWDVPTEEGVSNSVSATVLEAPTSTPTRTPTRTATPKRTPTPTPTATPTPTGTPTDASWHSPSATGGEWNDWANPANAYHNDDLYATAAGQYREQDYYSFGFDIPEGATINGIEVRIEAHGHESIGKVRCALRRGSFQTPSFLEYWFEFEPGDDTSVIRGRPSDLWGLTWSPSDFVDDVFSVRCTTHSWTGTAKVDHIQVKVHYTTTSTCCNYDFDNSGVIDVADIMEVAGCWRSTDPECASYDLDGDGDIDVVDIMKVVACWGETCD
jgi:cell wall-associated NlpC family hydrolase